MSFRSSALLLLLLASLSTAAQILAPTVGTLDEADVSFGGDPMGGMIPSFSGAGGALVGSVKQEDGSPVFGARVEITELTNQRISLIASTRNNGSFEFHNLPDGTYDVHVVSGLRDAREQVMVRRNEAEVVFRLSSPRATGSVNNNGLISVSQLKIPGKARKAFDKAASLFSKKKFADALAPLNEAIRLYANYAQALTLRGVLHMQKGQTTEAESDFAEAIKSDESYGMSYLGLASLYNDKQKFSDAYRVIRQGLSVLPQTWQVNFEMGRAEVGSGDFSSGLRTLNKIEMAPGVTALVHIVKANALLGLKKYPDARQELEQYLVVDPYGPSAMQAKDTLEKLQAIAP